MRWILARTLDWDWQIVGLCLCSCSGRVSRAESCHSGVVLLVLLKDLELLRYRLAELAEKGARSGSLCSGSNPTSRDDADATSASSQGIQRAPRSTPTVLSSTSYTSQQYSLCLSPFPPLSSSGKARKLMNEPGGAVRTLKSRRPNLILRGRNCRSCCEIASEGAEGERAEEQ